MTNAVRGILAAGAATMIVLLFDAAAARLRQLGDHCRRRRRLSAADPTLASAIRQVGSGRWGD